MDCGWCVKLSIAWSNQYHQGQHASLMPLVFQLRFEIINGYGFLEKTG